MKLLKESGFTFQTNTFGRRMKLEELVELGRDCQGLVAGVEEYSAETLDQLPNLRCISRSGVGIDNIDLLEAERRGIAVLSTADEPTIAVAELTLAMMLTLLRRLSRVDLLMHERKWERVTGHLLAGKRVGIIGLGRIGRRVTHLVQAFGATVVGTDPYPDSQWVHASDVQLLELPELLARVDIVSIHASASREHQLRLGSAELATMKQGAWLINMARGDMVDDVALNQVLASGHLSGAGLDVFPEEPYRGCLCDNNRVVLSPHQATLTVETRASMETRAVKNLVQYLRAAE